MAESYNKYRKLSGVAGNGEPLVHKFKFGEVSK
jgi:hypothetical protein